MKMKNTKEGNESLHPLGAKLEKILDVMDDVRTSLDRWNIEDCDISPPCLEVDDGTGEIEFVTLIGDYDFRFSVEDFVNRTFDVLECGEHSFASAFINFRRQFDEAVIERFERYKDHGDPDEVEWAEGEMAMYKRI